MIEIQRYMIFFSPHYYPHGGIEDIIGQSDDLDSAIKICMNCATDENDIPGGEFHIVDLKEFKQAEIDIDYEEKVSRELFDDLKWEEIKVGYWI